MKKYNTLYYFLFVLLILGAFASMAQFSYGLVICGIACLGFTGAFLVEAFQESKPNGLSVQSKLNILSLLIFAAIAFIYMLRNFSFDFPQSGIIMTALLTILLITTILRAVDDIRDATPLGLQTVLPVILYNTALIIFILFLLVGPIFPAYENTLALTGLVVFALFLVLIAFFGRPKKNVDEDRSGTRNFRRLLVDKSMLVVAIGLLFGILNLLVSNRIFPPLYRGTIPDGYEHLVNHGAGESGTLKAEQFKDQYEKFTEHQGKW
jgi:hypothetical protein